jgi:hypothetical protein
MKKLLEGLMIIAASLAVVMMSVGAWNGTAAVRKAASPQ